MELETKRANLAIPSYSVKEDALPFLNCRLQYRYHRGGSLPYASMERFWFGLFIHGVLELAYHFWKNETDPPSFPWPCVRRERRGDTPNWADHDIGKFANTVEESLRRQGVRAPIPDARNSAYDKVGFMVNALGAHLFPLIDKVEHKISATRPMPQIGSSYGRDSYELRGVLDALARAVPVQDSNLIREYVKKDCPNINRNSELILEYKGARRPDPARGASLWNQDELQVQAYAWLRERESRELPAAGIVIYVNELSSPTPTRGELDKAIRVIPISRRTVDNAIAKIDDIARQIEDALADEETNGSAIRSWSPNCQDKSVCSDCDFRHFCPKPAGTPQNYAIKAPTAP